MWAIVLLFISWSFVYVVLQLSIGFGAIFLPYNYIVWIPYILNFFILYKVVVTIQWRIFILHIGIVIFFICAKFYLQTPWELSLKIIQNNGIGNSTLITDSANEIYANYCPTTISEQITTGNGSLLWYLDNGEYLNVLSSYTCDLSSSRTLVVYGKKSVGKSRGLYIATDHWQKQGRLVLSVSLKGKNNEDSLPPLKHAWQYLTHRTDWTPLRALLAAYLGFAGSEAHHNFGILLRLMEVVALRHPTLSPIIVFENLQLITKFADPRERDEGLRFLKQVLVHLQVRKTFGSPVPVILETSDSLWAYENGLQNKANFWIYLVDGLDKEVVEHQLVEQLQFWDQLTFNAVWQVLGNHPEDYPIVHHLVKRVGMTVEKALSEVSRSAEEFVFAVISDVDHAKMLERIDCLKQLHSQNWCIVASELIEQSPWAYLLEKNLLFISRGKITPQNPLLQKALQVYLLEQAPVVEKGAKKR